MNILEVQDALKDFSQDQLVKEMQAPSGQAPQFLVLSELNRRQRMKQDFDARQAQQQPTVAEKLVAAAGAPQGGIGAMAQSMAPQTDMAMNTGVSQMEEPMSGEVMKMNPGGSTNFRIGGQGQGTALNRGNLTQEDLLAVAKKNNMSLQELKNTLASAGFPVESVEDVKEVQTAGVSDLFNRNPFSGGLEFLFDRSPFGSTVKTLADNNVPEKFTNFLSNLNPIGTAQASPVNQPEPEPSSGGGGFGAGILSYLDQFRDSPSDTPLERFAKYTGGFPIKAINTLRDITKAGREGIMGIGEVLTTPLDEFGTKDNFDTMGQGGIQNPATGKPYQSFDEIQTDFQERIVPKQQQKFEAEKEAEAQGTIQDRIVDLMEQRQKSADMDKYLALAQAGFTLMQPTEGGFGEALGKAGVAGIQAYQDASDRYQTGLADVLDTEIALQKAMASQDTTLDKIKTFTDLLGEYSDLEMNTGQDYSSQKKTVETLIQNLLSGGNTVNLGSVS